VYIGSFPNQFDERYAVCVVKGDSVSVTGGEEFVFYQIVLQVLAIELFKRFCKRGIRG
jgi:hypothetical protein